MKKKLFVGLAALFMTLGLASCASDGKTPYIGDNGNWWIGETDTGVPATGPAGQDGKDGKDGTNGTNGTNGTDGTSVTVTSVEKTGTDGLVDTYTITFSDGTITSFTVTNGESNVIESIELTGSTELVDTYTITFTNGSTKTFTVANGKDGENLTIVSIELKSSEGLIDTYVINYSDGSKFEFVVSNGADGLTPYIGENGNWWIGDTDTGVLADWEKANNVPLTYLSNGLTYSTMTINYKSGYVVTGWDDDFFEEYTLYDLIAQGMSVDEAEEYIDILEDEANNGHLVIPNYIGSVPVIGVWQNSGLNFGKVTLSRNTVFLGDGAFNNCQHLREVDFNNAHITQIPECCFKGTAVGNITLPSSVSVIQDEAFVDVKMTDFDFSNIKYIGSKAFCSLFKPFVYLPKTVKYVGADAFSNTRVYIEHETYPSDWAATITSTSEGNGVVSTKCKIGNDYLYSIEDNNVTVYQYLGNEKDVVVPSTIEDKPVKKIGYGFASAPYRADLYYEERYYNGEESLANIVFDLETITIPEGVTDIGNWAFCALGEMIILPSSLERMSEIVLDVLEDPDDAYLVLPGMSNGFVLSSYVAFTGNNLPQIIDATSGNPTDRWTKANLEENGYRVSFDINPTKIEKGNGFYYLNEGTNYSLMAYMGLKYENLVIPSTFNEKAVQTIMRGAISYDPTIKTIVLEDGIKRIRPSGIVTSNQVEYIYIPSSVEAINANGIYLDGTDTKIFVQASSKPVDWDSNWTNRLSNAVFGLDGEVGINKFFLYTIKNNKVTLFSYFGNSSNVYIPDELGGYPVTTIKGGFYERNGGAEIYIPSSVETIEASAFVNKSSKKFVFYLEASEIKEGWNNNWYYNSYNASASAYVTKNWDSNDKFNYKYSDEFAYCLENDGVTLLSFCGGTDRYNVPRKINDITVKKIRAYCFYFDKSAKVFVPSSIETIEQYGFELYTSSYSVSLQLYCQPSSQPSGWGYYFACNSYYQNNTGISIYWNRTYIS